MRDLQQGTIIRLSAMPVNLLVLSREFFNRSGMTVVCPVVETASPDALHIPITSDRMNGTALLEQLRSIDLHARHYVTIGEIPLTQIQDISDAVQDIFNYYPF